MGINYGLEEKENGAYGNRSQRRNMLDKDDIVRGGRSLDTLDRRGSTYAFHSSSGFERHHRHYHQHPHRRGEK